MARLLRIVCSLALAARAEHPCDTRAPELRLPFSADAAREVIQGVDGSFSHFGRSRYAWDFAMAEGTPVLSAADGTVVEVIDRFDAGGADRSFEEKANLVIVDHGGGRFSVYQHLRRGGALVREGDRVARGQTIGQSGNTGWTTRPHLHFALVDYRNELQPACFADVPDGWPRKGQSYRSSLKASAAAAAVPLSTLPRDAFAQNGILLDGDLPARWLGRATPVRIDGHTTRTGDRVVAFFLPRGSDRATRWWYGKVGPDGRFSVTVDFTGLEGTHNFAMAIAAADGRFNSGFSVPVSLRPRN
jgi:Peptidase family M23